MHLTTQQLISFVMSILALHVALHVAHSQTRCRRENVTTASWTASWPAAKCKGHRRRTRLGCPRRPPPRPRPLVSTVIPQPTSRACPHLNGTRRTAGRLLMLEFDADPDLKFNFPPSPVIPFACNCVLMSVVVSSTLPICDRCRQYLIASLTGAFFPRWKIQLTAEQHAVAGISGTDGIPKGVTTSATSPRVPFVLVSCLEPCICQLLHYPLVQACQIPHLDALFPLLVALSKAPRVRPHLRFYILLNSLWVHPRCGTGGGVSFVSLLCPYHQRYYFRSLITPCSTAIVRPFILHPSCPHI